MSRVTVAEAARLRNVSEQALRAACADGRLAGAAKVRGLWVIPLEDLERYEPRRIDLPPRPTGPRWPLQPLLDASGLTVRQLARRARYWPGNGHAWSQRGDLSTKQAEHLARRADLDPAEVWPDWPPKPQRRRSEGRVGGPKWPLEPVLQLTDLSPGALAQVAGYSRKSGERWAAAGVVGDAVADELAVVLGLHPALIWDDWYEATTEAAA